MWHKPSPQEQQVIPNPDPSSLTADKIHHDISALESILQSRIDGIQSTIEARLAAMDKASELFDANLNRIPTSVDRQVSQLRELHDARFKAVEQIMAGVASLRDEKFASIQQQLDERDVRYSLVSSDAKTAVADALAAQSKAVEKQDASTQSAINKQSELFTGLTNSQTQQINDLKDRMTRAETATANSIAAQSTKSTNVGQLISWGLLAIAALAFILPLLEHFSTAAK